MAIHSDWGDWLPRAVVGASPDGVAIWYLGCNGFVLKATDGTTLFVDPYFGTGDPPRTVRMIPVPMDPADVTAADAVLITHEHTDHAHWPSVGPILQETDAALYGPDDSIAAVREGAHAEGQSIPDDRVTAVSEGDSFGMGSFEVHVAPANDPDATHPVSYVLSHGAGTFFHGGDTKPGAALATIGDDHDIDLGVLAFGSHGVVPDKGSGEPAMKRWYADENGVIEAANALEIDRLLPSHWDMWRGLTADPDALRHHARSFPHPRRIEVAEIGDRVDL